MHGGSAPQAARVSAAQANVRALLRNWSDEAFEEHAMRFTASYWLAADPEVTARNARIMRKADRRKNPYALSARTADASAVTEIILYAADEPGLFARVAGAMAVSGVNIVDAKIMTTTDGMALDTFYIQNGGGRAVLGDERLDKLAATIEASLKHEIDPDKLLSRKPRLASRTSVFKVVPRVLIDNQASYLYTVVEINGRDRPRLLYDVTKAIAALGLSTTSAHIQTFGERAVDVFYVKDKFGLKIEKPRQRERIIAGLIDALNDDDTKQKQTATTKTAKRAKGATKPKSKSRQVPPTRKPREDAVSKGGPRRPPTRDKPSSSKRASSGQ